MQFITLTDAFANTRVQIAPERGAIVTSFAVGARELLYMDMSTLSDTSKNVRGGIPILFPIAGKLQNDAWRCDGREGLMKQHGFARQLAWEILAVNPSQLSLGLKSNDVTLQQYPWEFSAVLTYSLLGTSLRTTLQVTNCDQVALPFALGFHPYFLSEDKQRARITTRATKSFNNVTKQVEAFSGFDFTATEVDLHLLNHLSDTAVLTLHAGNIEIQAARDFGVWVVWTLGGKEFICLEPWTAPGNALNSGDQLLRIAPGQTHESWTVISFLPTS